LKITYFYDTPIGRLGITENNFAITNVDFEDKSNKNNVKSEEIGETPLIKEAAKQMQEYFDGKRKTFELPISVEGTEFQKSVWKALQEIPYGETKTYKEIAIAIGNEKACRAVGMANNKNPISIIVPCHRVIGTNGKLVGYAGGLDKKEHLLEIENKNKNKWEE